MAERPTSFAQQEILAPLELTKGDFVYVAKNSMGGHYTAHAQRVNMLD
jgi:hypothetical protein